ncbi:hypothetical protein [Microcoleus sp. OTE_8_concoct_300]|uniref:hypothetical protein n=1 Tax=Microcoleus sp. OTE_8_concoct_300 TaxID=2964710 RepID=UPI00403FBF0B
MNLKQLRMSLAGKPKPDPAQAVWVVNCPEKVEDDFAGAIAEAECEFEDNFRPFDRPEGRKEFCIGSTAYLADCVAHLTAEEIDRDWESVCRMMDW